MRYIPPTFPPRLQCLPTQDTPFRDTCRDCGGWRGHSIRVSGTAESQGPCRQQRGLCPRARACGRRGRDCWLPGEGNVCVSDQSASGEWGCGARGSSLVGWCVQRAIAGAVYRGVCKTWRLAIRGSGAGGGGSQRTRLWVRAAGCGAAPADGEVVGGSAQSDTVRSRLCLGLSACSLSVLNGGCHVLLWGICACA